jgi:Cu+-exporting ATPase
VRAGSGHADRDHGGHWRGRPRILIKDAEALEVAHRVSVVAFDKTGTLTVGKPEVVALHAADGDEPALLAKLAALQAGSEHPLARAVTTLATERGITVPAATDVRALPGRGIAGIVAWQALQLGSDGLRASLQADAGSLQNDAERLRGEGRTVSWLIDTDQRRVLGLVAFGDAIKPGAAAAIARLREAGIHTVMLTGDNAGAAARVGKQLGLDEVQAEVMPEDKAARVSSRSSAVAKPWWRWWATASTMPRAGGGRCRHRHVHRHGRGDARGRHHADAGDPALVADALAVSHRTVRKIRQNLFWAFIYNVIGIPLAAAGLLNPVVAGAAMAFSSVSVVSNALLLRRWHPLAGSGHKEVTQ